MRQSSWRYLKSSNSHVDTNTKWIFDSRSLYPVARRHGACKVSFHTQKPNNATVDEETINDTTEQTQSRGDFVGIASEQRGRRHPNFPLELEPKKQLVREVRWKIPLSSVLSARTHDEHLAS